MATSSKDNIMEILRSKIRCDREDLTREDQTRTVLIDPLLYALGWDVSNPKRVRTEPRLNIGGRPDYVMHDSRSKRPFMIVEAKKLQTSLSGLTGVDHQLQLLGYMRELGCSLGVVTNGDDWQIYRADSFATLTPVKTLSVSRNTISDFVVIAAQDQRDAVDYRQRSEQWLRDEREKRRAADRELNNEQKARRKTKHRLARERKNRADAERWLANERARRKLASQPRTNKRIELVTKITIVVGTYLLAPVITALLFVLYG